MEINMITKGDSDTGIPDTQTTIETNITIGDFDEDARQELREKTKEYGELLHGEKIDEIWFEDECVDCQHRMKLNEFGVFICRTDRCPNNPKTLLDNYNSNKDGA